MKQILSALVAASGALIASAPFSASAADVTWGKPTTISHNSNVIKTGKLFQAVSFQGGGIGSGEKGVGDIAVNGVTFTEFDAYQGSTTATPITQGNISITGNITDPANYNGCATSVAFGKKAAPFNTLSPSYQALLSSGVFDDHGGNLTLTLSGLTTGHKYKVQLFVNDARGTANRSETVTGGTKTSKAVLFSSTPTEGSIGQFITGTFIADGTASQVLTLTGTPDAPLHTQLNALLITDLSGKTTSPPEPAPATTPVHHHKIEPAS